MLIYPVLDLLGGIVVRGVAGQRDRYAAIQSTLCDSADPLTVATTLSEQFGLQRFYLADLDAILYGQPNRDTWNQLRAAGFELLIDAGVRDESTARQVLHSGADAVILGLETCSDPELPARLLNDVAPERVWFSLDLKHGQPLGDLSRWGTSSPLDIARCVLAAGIRNLIVLDLAGVGVGAGVPTLGLCREIKEQFPQTHLVTGGGVRHRDDLWTLKRQGLDGVLIASALHNGQLTPDDLGSLGG